MTKTRLLLLASLLILFALPAKAQTNPKVTLTWNPSTTAGATYQVYREQTAGACTLTSTGTGPGCLLLNATPITPLPTDTTVTYVDNGASYTSTVFYIVKASATGFTSAFSNEITVNIPAKPVPVNAPVINCQITIANGVASGPCQ